MENALKFLFLQTNQFPKASTAHGSTPCQNDISYFLLLTLGMHNRNCSSNIITLYSKRFAFCCCCTWIKKVAESKELYSVAELSGQITEDIFSSFMLFGIAESW